MKVVATKRGYDNVVVREEGEEFEMPEGSKGSWFTPVKAAARAEGKAKPANGGRPATVAELASQQADHLPDLA